MDRNSNKKVAAIVPAYNEGKNIKPVLDSLSNCRIIDEIVVVDDGSPLDGIMYLAPLFPNIKFISHSKNKGKAAAMETGLRNTSAPYIFFCDADLSGFMPEHAEDIISPVVSGQYRTYIGIRKNPAQRAVLWAALNSGERCLLRNDWEALPKFYKKGYRIETGLNVFIRKKGKIGYQIFPYYQSIKEKKYGLWQGTKQRWIMNWDVVLAWLYHWFIEK